VLGRDPLPTSGRHFFSLYLNQINWAVYSVGIVKQSRRNYEKSYESKDCICFFAKEGTVWQEKGCRGGGSPVYDGVEIRVVVDWLKGLIKWYQEGI
jgi:hypothetical protein